MTPPFTGHRTTTKLVTSMRWERKKCLSTSGPLNRCLRPVRGESQDGRRAFGRVFKLKVGKRVNSERRKESS